MSDLYDYAYMHVMRPDVKVNNCTDSNTENVVNTDDFSSRDLQLFVDSMETISRLEKAKYEQRQKRKIQKHLESFEKSKKIITCLDASLCDEEEEEEQNLQTSYALGADYTVDDDTFYATPYQDESIATYSNITSSSLHSLATDSVESGVFFNTTVESNVYENIDVVAMRPRAQVISQPKCKTMKSRLIALIMKKQYCQPEAPAADMFSSTTYGEDLDDSAICDRVLDDVIQQQFTKNSKKFKKKYRLPKKEQSPPSPEEKFLNKAMSCMAF